MTIQTVPFSKLSLSDRNVRQSRDQAFIEHLAANIEAQGILQNLIVTELPDCKLDIDAGGNRYLAVAHLIEQGRAGEDFPMPVMLNSNEDSKEAGLSENFMRQSMHPMDEAEAFSWLFKRYGLSVEEIAQRFGVKPLFVKQRMKLDKLPQELKTAYREGAMSLSMLACFTVSDDAEKQCEVWRSVKEHGGNENTIKRALLEEGMEATHRLVKFVGLEAYEKAGGTVATDLFFERQYIEDRALVEKLAAEKLEAIAAEQNGVKWVKTSLEQDFQFIWNCGRVSRKATDKTREIEAQIEALEAQLEEMEQDEDAEQEVIDALAEQIQTLEGNIEDSFQVDPEELASSGCYITVNGSGELDITTGLIHPDDIAKAAVAEASDGSSETPAKALSDALSGALTDDLMCYQQAAVKSDLSTVYAVALDALLHSMVVSAIPRYFESLIDVRVQQTFNETTRKDMADSQDNQQLETLIAEVLAPFHEAESSAEIWTILRKMDPKQKKKLLSALVARSLQKPCPNSELFGELKQCLKTDVRSHWSPSFDNFWNRCPAPALDRWYQELVEKEFAAETKKKHKAQEMARKFNVDSESEKVGKWLPEILR